MIPLVLLHGWGSNAAVFDGLRQTLGDAFEVTAPDLFARADGPWDLDTLIASLALRAPERCTVLGWSLGAQIALRWSELRPEQVTRLVLVAPNPSFVQRESWPCAMSLSTFDAFARAVADDVDATLSRFCSLQAQGDLRSRTVLRTLRDALAARRPAEAARLAWGLSLLREHDLREAVARVSQPTLIVHGARDALVPLAAAEWTAAAMPEARLSVLGGAGHVPFVSAPSTVAALVGAFCSE